LKSASQQVIAQLHEEIAAAALEHATTHAEAIARFGERITASYASLVDTLIVELRGDAATLHWVQPVLDVLKEYLLWLQWTSWNVANLAPVAATEIEEAAALTAATTLAYAAGRLVDDGIDDHLDHKGARQTFRAVFEQLEPSAPSLPARPLSVFLGLCAFQCALRSLRRTRESFALATFVERRFSRVASGVLAELRSPGNPELRAYESVVRRKAVNYNMILYGPLAAFVEPRHLFVTLRALGEIDRLAQVVNDYRDRNEDVKQARLNCFSSGIVTDAETLLAASLVRNWRRIGSLPPMLRGALAAMLFNVKPLGLLMHTSNGVGSGAHLQQSIDAAIARLRSWQLPSGELPTYHSADPSMQQPTYARSPFVSGMVALALRRSDVGELRALVDRALSFVLTARAEDGTIAFLPSGIDPDLDDTCLLNAILQQRGIGGIDYTQLASLIAALPTHDGLFQTWFRNRAAPNDIDPVVSVNVVRFLAQNGIDRRDTVAAVCRSFTLGKVDVGSTYYTSWTALPYFVSSLVPFVRRRFDNDSAWHAKVVQMLEAYIADAANPVEVAMALTVASTWHVPVHITERLARALLDAQLSDGGWPSCVVFRAFNNWGSGAISTALALEALLHHRRR
jgi:hypothetical protein